MCAVPWQRGSVAACWSWKSVALQWSHWGWPCVSVCREPGQCECGVEGTVVAMGGGLVPAFRPLKGLAVQLGRGKGGDFSADVLTQDSEYTVESSLPSPSAGRVVPAGKMTHCAPEAEVLSPGQLLSFPEGHWPPCQLPDGEERGQEANGCLFL